MLVVLADVLCLETTLRSALAAVAAASGKKPTVGHLDLITERVTRQVEATGIPALALGIVCEGKLVYEKGFGNDVTADTSFPSCSTAKPITAMVVMKLIEEGVLDLDRPVVEHMPDLDRRRCGIMCFGTSRLRRVTRR